MLLTVPPKVFPAFSHIKNVNLTSVTQVQTRFEPFSAAKYLFSSPFACFQLVQRMSVPEISLKG